MVVPNVACGSPKCQIALDYVRRGLCVIPGDSSGDTKRPLIPWGHLTDEDHLDKLARTHIVCEGWSTYTMADIFMVTGRLSDNVCVIDLDEHPERGISGYETLQEWEREHGDLFCGSDTVTAISGSGGIHIYFRDISDTLNGYAQLAGSTLGVDIRANGQLAVMPGSRHKSGRFYEWENHPDDYPILDATDNLYAFIEHCRPEFQKEHRSTLNSSLHREDPILEGTRDETIFRMACSLRAKCFPQRIALSLCLGENLLRCKPPLDEKTVIEKVLNAYSYPNQPSKSQSINSNKEAR